MKNKIIYFLVFVLGFLSCAFVLSLNYGFEVPLNSVIASSNNVNSPSNWVDQNSIIVYEDKIVINIENSSLSRYAPTGSMKPVFDYGANGIRVVPETPEQINVGDIVSFRKGNNLIVHRVVKKGEDEEGIYFITKGDNNSYTDGKIRFEEIEYVTVGVIW